MPLQRQLAIAIGVIALTTLPLLLVATVLLLALAIFLSGIAVSPTFITALRPDQAPGARCDADGRRELGDDRHRHGRWRKRAENQRGRAGPDPSDQSGHHRSRPEGHEGHRLQMLVQRQANREAYSHGRHC
jgi:hypothetical protein